AQTVLAGELGCLLNIAGRLRRQGSPVRAYHVAEVLAGMTDDGIGGEEACSPRRIGSRSRRGRLSPTTACRTLCVAANAAASTSAPPPSPASPVTAAGARPA